VRYATPGEHEQAAFRALLAVSKAAQKEDAAFAQFHHNDDEKLGMYDELLRAMLSVRAAVRCLKSFYVT